MAILHARTADHTIGRPLWALTTYFNPIGYSSRLANFRLFRRALAAVPLITVELGHRNHFELTAAESDILIQVTGTDVLWQKERLLNLALAQVPREAEYVAWLDCDVLLERRDWPAATIDALRTRQLVQLFSDLHDLPQAALPPAASETAAGTGHSIAHLIASGEITVADLDPSAVSPRSRYTAWGLAWAARKSLLARHGFYDALVIGSGDRALACAAYGRHDNPILVTKMNGCQQAHYLRWAEPFHRDVQSHVGCVDGRLFHLWHGDFKHRRYRERHETFSTYPFDPTTDLVVNRSGAYEWAGDRRDLAEFCHSYFLSRLEDGVAVT